MIDNFTKISKSDTVTLITKPAPEKSYRYDKFKKIGSSVADPDPGSRAFLTLDPDPE
jgi:hypothetical protein